MKVDKQKFESIVQRMLEPGAPRVFETWDFTGGWPTQNPPIAKSAML